MKHSFVGVGFAKCATTTLDAVLRQHPDLALPCHKETLFFERHELYKRGLEWYEKRYYGNPKKYKDKILGEINPRNQDCEKKILQTFGSDIKLIYILRNPIDAIFSLFKHNIIWGGIYSEMEKNMWTEKCFDSFVNLYLHNKSRNTRRELFSSYLYGKKIVTALKHIPTKNIYIILFEDFVKNPETEAKRLFQFLGVNADVPINYNVWENSGKRVPKSPQAMQLARQRFSFWLKFYVPNFPYMGHTIERKMDDWYWTILDKASIPTDKPLKMSEETREKLREFYRPDVELLDRTLHTNFGERWGF